MPYIPLPTIRLIANEFEKKLSGYSVQKFTHGDFLTVYLIDDSLVLLAQIIGHTCHLCANPEEMYGWYRGNSYLEFPVEGHEYYSLRIEKLTPNTIGFKYMPARESSAAPSMVTSTVKTWRGSLARGSSVQDSVRMENLLGAMTQKQETTSASTNNDNICKESLPK